MYDYRGLFVLLTLVLGCADGHISGRTYSQEDASSSSALDAVTPQAPSQSSVAAFAQHMLPVLRDMCAGCHGATQAPLFAVDDAAQAHRVLIEGNKINFEDTANSRLVLRLTADSHNCVNDCRADGDKFIKAIDKWKNARTTTDAEAAESLVTKGINPSGVKRLRYEIGHLLGEQYGEETIMLQMNIHRLAGGGGYVLSNVQIETRNVSVYVKGIKPLIDGDYNPNNSSLTAVACASHPPASVLSNFSNSTVQVEDLNSAHTLAFAFAEIRLATDADADCEREDGMNEVLAQQNNKFNQTMRRNFRSYCSCHGIYFEGEGALRSVWTSREDIVSRMTTDTERIMPPTQGAAQLPDYIKDEMLRWLNAE